MALHIEKINHEIARLIRIEYYRTQRINLWAKSGSNGRVIGYSTVSNTDLCVYIWYIWGISVYVFICNICECVIHVYEEDVQMTRMLCVVDINREYTWNLLWLDVDWYVLDDKCETDMISEKYWLCMIHDSMTVYMTDQMNE